MPVAPHPRRPLGTMIAYGFPGQSVAVDLAIAQRLGATLVEILPDWRAYPDPRPLARAVADAGLAVHSAHGCWGGQSIAAPRVDLAALDPATRAASIDDLRRCLDWLSDAGGAFLVVHPGGLSDPEDFAPRREALAASLLALADHARSTGVVVCVENMPPGVHPGSRMADIAALVAEIGRPELALALDTGHAQITHSPAAESLAAHRLLRTTHVHDNDGRQDTHLPPGLGIVDWESWRITLNTLEYSGPILLECIRILRRQPELITDAFLALLHRLTVRD